MGPSERADRMRRNLEFSTRLTTVNWATQVLYDLKCVDKSSDKSAYSGVGFGMGFRVMGIKQGFETLDAAAVNKSYRATKNRLILLDWGGTLVAEGDITDRLQAYALATGITSRSGPTDTLKHILESLCADPKNIVFVVSGKETAQVAAFFGDVKGLGLGSEHGFYYKWPEGAQPPVRPTSPGSRASIRHQKWTAMHTLNEMDHVWKEPARKLMNLYTERTHGTYIERKGNAMLWQFRDADPEFGYMQSKELEEHLSELMAEHPVQVIRGGGVADGYIEIRPAGVSKGLFLKHALGILESQRGPVDFIMAIGDDSCDEPMFEQIQELQVRPNLHGYSVAVGRKPTAAQSYLDDPAAVLELLSMLSKTSTMVRSYSSSQEIFGSSDMLARLPTRVSSSSLLTTQVKTSTFNDSNEVNKDKVVVLFIHYLMIHFPFRLPLSLSRMPLSRLRDLTLA